MIVGEATRTTISKLKPENRRAVFLSIRSFFSTSVSYLQKRLPLQNVAKGIGMFESKLAKKLQPELDTSLVQDEWRVTALRKMLHYWMPTKGLTIFGNLYFL